MQDTSSDCALRTASCKPTPTFLIGGRFLGAGTGTTSVGDEAITFRMFALPVWEVSASCRSRVLACTSSNSRVLSMAIRAWSRKDSASAISLSPKILACLPANARTPMHSVSRSSGRNSAEFSRRAGQGIAEMTILCKS